ncbi:hypothetical protein GL218_02892 [Daldinia childiae]|uniref:uncharacterized protein n=1 Tax=Daldinia childiae TaxID=326645 RepID=UPI001445FB40|nr:uncharacterized protein GL218_02892 [Daldinia childiae]KAF3061391.1 hypothetical protein GL218_02892 [Daldinia childiae]
MAQAAGPSWDADLKSVAAQLHDRLLKKEKAVSFNTDFDKAKVESIIHELLNSLVPDLAKVRHDALEESLKTAQERLHFAVEDKEKAEETTSTLKTELLDVEEKYDHAMTETKKEHQNQLILVETEKFKKDDMIQALKTNIRDIENENKLFIARKDRDFNELDKNFKKLAEQKKLDDKELKRIREHMRLRDVDLKQEKNWGEEQKRQHDEKDEELKKANKMLGSVLRELEKAEKQVAANEEKEKELKNELDERERKIGTLETKVAEFTRLRSGSVRSTRTSSDASQRGAGNLGNELEAEKDRENILQLDAQIVDLNGELAGVRIEVKQVQKERDDLQAQLKKANVKIDELNKEVTRLKPFEDQANTLAIRERELQSQAKAKGQELKKAEDDLNKANAEIKRLQRGPGSKATTPTVVPAAGLDAAVEECEKEKAQLGKHIEQLEQELEQLQEDLKKNPSEDEINELRRRLAEAEEELKKKPSEDEINELRRLLDEAEEELKKKPSEDEIIELRRLLAKAQEDLTKNPSADEINELRRLLTQAERDLKAEQEARAQLEETLKNLRREALAKTAEHERETRRMIADHAARIKKLAADFKAKQGNTNDISSALATFWEELAEKISARSQEVQDMFEKELAVNHTMRDQYAERLARMNEDINRNPLAPETALARRRVAGVEREIERMNGIIDTITKEATWFEDVMPEFAVGAQHARDVRTAAGQVAAATTAAAEAAQAEAAAAAAAATARAEAESAVLRAQAQAAVARAEAETATATQNRVIAETRRAMWRDGWQGLRGLFWRDRWNVVAIANLWVMFLMVLLMLAHAREMAIWKSANAPLQRAFYVNTVDQSALCFRRPSWALLWEFIIALFTGQFFMKIGN